MAADKSEVVMVTPNEMMNAAKGYMLDGREPVTEDDWVKVINFVAANIVLEVRIPATWFLATLYDCPLTREQVEYIAMMQGMDTIVDELLQ